MVSYKKTDKPDYKWLRLTKSDYKRLQVTMSDYKPNYKWLRVTTRGYKWLRVTTNDYKRLRVKIRMTTTSISIKTFVVSYGYIDSCATHLVKIIEKYLRCRKSRLKMFFQVTVLKNFVCLFLKTPVFESLFNKVAGPQPSSLQ